METFFSCNYLSGMRFGCQKAYGGSQRSWGRYIPRAKSIIRPDFYTKGSKNSGAFGVGGNTQHIVACDYMREGGAVEY